MKKVLKRILLVFVILYAAYHMVFYTVKLPKSYVRELKQDYGEYILFSVDEFDWGRWMPSWINSSGPFGKMFMSGGYYEPEKHVLLFRWNAYKMEKRMKNKLREELESLKKYPCVTGYTYDEDKFIVDVYMDESETEDSGEYSKVYLYVYDVLQRDKFSLLGNFCKRVDPYTYEWNGRFEIHKKENEVEKSYNENELDTLEEILSRSKQEKPTNLKWWEGARWEEDETEEGEVVFYFTRLDLSEYPDISGELDLSKFEHLEYVSLNGMEISRVILPDTLETIDEKSFKDCKNLEEIKIPKSVWRFDTPVFSGCEKLKKVIFEGDAPETAVVLSDGRRIYKTKKVFGEVSEDFTIYYAKASDGWDNECWKQYHMEVLE